MKIFDTSVYIAAFLEQDAHHEEGKRILDTESGKILLPYCVVLEILTVLTYKHSRGLADAFWNFVLQDSRFTLLDAGVLEDTSFWERTIKRISFADITIVFLARKYEAELVTFDKDQKKLFLEIGET